MSTTHMETEDLAAFQRFLTEQGWVEQPKVGRWEALRMRHPERLHPLLVHCRKRPELGLTLHGESTRMHRKWRAS